jgi:hypothetical protein
MSFWPFGSDPAEIEVITRVITASTQNGYTVRGKLTIHFAEPERQADADAAADRCAQIAAVMLREAQSHERVIGAETRLSAVLHGRYPVDLARARAIELAALHVVGDPALSDELRRASASAGGPMHPLPSSPPSGPLASPPPSYRTPPAPSVGPASTPAPASKRRGSSQLRALQSLLMPPGTPPAGMGAYIAPMVRDSAGRLLVGFLRAHDLITLRGVALDESSAEALASVVPVSDAPPGGYEASRAAELLRWQAALGEAVIRALHREVNAIITHLAREAMLRAEVPRALSTAVTEALCAAAFPDDAGMLAELGRFPDALSPALITEGAHRLSAIADAGDDPASMAAALTPLLAVIQEDLNHVAMIIKHSSG